MIGALLPRFALILALALITATRTCASVYFVAIGSTHYAGAPPDAHAFGYLSGANRSARAVAARFSRGGAVDGTVLISAPDHFVTNADVMRVIDEMIARIKARGDTNPFLVVYYAGHGISEGVGWNHFLIPGTFAFKGDSNHLDVGGLAASTTHSAALVERLKKAATPYMLVLDTCYEGKEASFQSSVLTGTAIDNLAAVAGVLRYMNEFHQADPVLFSTPPGTKVPTADDPADPSQQLGPLGRRLVLLLDPAWQAHRPTTLYELVERLSATDLDTATRPAVTLATPDATWSRTIVEATPGTAGASRTEFGSGTTAIVCCARPATDPGDAPRPVSGRLKITGTPGEYITNGKTYELASPAYALSVIESKGALRIEADKGDDTWEIELSAPHDAMLTAKSYPNAGRYGFDDNQPGLAITSPGRACNDLTGEFDVKDVSYDTAGRLAHLEVTLIQQCEDAKGHSSATLRIDAVR